MKKYTAIITSMVIIVVVGCQGNHAPVIQEVIANPDSIGPGENTTLFVDAEDEDGDALTITWSCITGTFSSTTGNSVMWTAPDSTANYSIHVVVEDEEGLSADGYVTVRVGMISLNKPTVSYEVRDNGGTLYLFWATVVNAEGYFIYADSQQIFSTTTNEYSATVPAGLYEVSAYAGTFESERDSIDCKPVITTSITVYGNSDPNPAHPSGIGFQSSGNCVTLALGDSTNWPSIDFYFKDNTFDPIRIASPDTAIPPFNTEHNTSVNSALTLFDSLKIADAPGTYSSTTPLYEYNVYSLWIDPNDNGWDNVVDHFVKMRVESITGSSPPYIINIRLAYQLIPGLRWLVTD